MTLPLDALYRDIILDHYRSPRGIEEITDISAAARGSNPSCGDELEMALTIKDNKIVRAHVKTSGCAISVASSSMMVETIEGMTLKQAADFGQTIRAMMHGEDPPDDVDLGDIDSLKGVRKFPVRVKCAMLTWVALLEAIRQYQDGTSDSKLTITTE
ncbi:SUF system NifU family Fe-S cluster assembly protein [Gemmatimonas aurantiaca]|nr:SUF system NifU family Fe-S cluster assembly protein [Gemmatimonas aurantiaca]